MLGCGGGIDTLDKFKKSKIRLEVEGADRPKVEKILREINIEYEINFKKSADAATMIGLGITTFGNIMGLIGILIALKKQKTPINVNLFMDGKKIGISEENKKKITEALKDAFTEK